MRHSQAGDVTLVTAMAVAAAGALVSLGTAIVGVSHEAGSSGWLTAGGSGIAIAALAYVSRALVAGRLVVLPVADLLSRGEKRDELLAELVKQGIKREEEGVRRENEFRALLLREHGQ